MPSSLPRSGGRVVRMVGTGTPEEAFEIGEAPEPQPAPGEIVVRVAASGVAFADVKMRHGIYPGMPSFPFVPGYDFAGTVEGIGEGVSEFRSGQAVAGLSFVGSHAEVIALEPRYVAAMPNGTDPVKAAALVLNYVTAYQMIERVARVPGGGTVLVHGGGGGMGTALLDLARHRGFRAFATASRGKHDLVRRYGGEPIDYRTEDFVARMAAEGGADAVFDPIGGDHLSRSRAAAKRRGTVVGYGFAGAVDDKAIVRRTYVTFARMLLTPGPRARFYGILNPPFSRRRYIRADLETLLGMLAEGAIDPHVGATLPLRDAARAHAMLEAREATGKIVLDVLRSA